MPLYELALRFPDSREEARLTEQHVAPGDTLSINGATWDVIAETLSRSSSEIGVTAAFLCRLSREQRSRAVEMRIEDEERRSRIN